MESTPWVRLPLRSCLTLVRHEPKARRGGLPTFRVLITEGGRSSSLESGGHTVRRPPSAPSVTAYGETVPGSSPSTSTSA